MNPMKMVKYPSKKLKMVKYNTFNLDAKLCLNPCMLQWNEPNAWFIF